MSLEKVKKKENNKKVKKKENNKKGKEKENKKTLQEEEGEHVYYHGVKLMSGTKLARA